jgi:hypothetical protein
MRTAILCLLVVVIGGCGMRTGRVGDADARRFYLTKDTFQGNQVLGACARGYHAASRFELLDVSSLRYDPTLGFTSSDAGMGPPGHAAAYGAEDPTGWVRTGGSSRYTDTGGAPGFAVANCSVWSSNSPEAFGTLAYLGDRFTTDDGAPAPVWNGRSERCNVPHHVWCIEDRRGTDDAEGSRRGRFRDDD